MKVVTELFGDLDPNERLVLFARMAFLYAVVAIAMYAGGAAMPWDTPITSLTGNATGRLALGLTTMGVVGGVGSFIWHGEMSTFAQRASYMTLGGAALIGAGKYVATFGTSGGLI